jgi:hypothetical protein
VNQSSKLVMRVRFPSPALGKRQVKGGNGGSSRERRDLRRALCVPIGLAVPLVHSLRGAMSTRPHAPKAAPGRPSAPAPILKSPGAPHGNRHSSELGAMCSPKRLRHRGGVRAVVQPEVGRETRPGPGQTHCSRVVSTGSAGHRRGSEQTQSLREHVNNIRCAMALQGRPAIDTSRTRRLWLAADAPSCDVTRATRPRSP